jgi:hypothetical protein
VALARRHPVIGGQLPLATFMRGRPKVRERALARGPARAARLEHAGRRAGWRAYVRRLLRDAYVLGLRDEIPSEEEFQRLLASLAALPPVRVDVVLGGAASPLPPLGPLELVLRVGDATVTRMIPVDPGSPWNVDEVIARLVDRSWRAARVATVREQLADATGPRTLGAKLEGAGVR